MKHLLRIYLLLLFCGANLHAETVFYKKDGTELTPDEHAKVYNIMIKYQFPINTFFGTYVDNELATMRKEIKQVLPQSDIEPTFMSTTLYEIWVIFFINKNWDNLENASENILKNEEGSFSLIKYIGNNHPKLFPKAAVQKESISGHRIINNFIIKILREKEISLPKNAYESIVLFNKLREWDDQLGERNRPFNIIFDKKYVQKKQNPSETEKKMGPDFLGTLIERAIKIDYVAYENNFFPLYRQASRIDSFEEESSTSWRSISFGVTLFGGYYLDTDASVFGIVRRMGRTSLVYAVLIDKKSYAQKNSILSNMFFIPPSTALQDIFGLGEFFHARSKVPSLDKVTLIMGGLDRQDPLQKKYYEIDPSIPGGAEQLYQQIRTYIQHHHIMVSDTTPIYITPRKSLPPSRPLPEFTPKKKSAAPHIPLPEFPQKKLNNS